MQPSRGARLLDGRSPRNTMPSSRRTPRPSPSAIDECVELLCQQGCRSVLGKITALERGEHIPETTSLGEEGRAAVFEELKSIMSVYGNTACGIEKTPTPPGQKGHPVHWKGKAPGAPRQHSNSSKGKTSFESR
uniref:Uncharacterized protein n=1 Tax=Candidatus Kentrum sp. LFY TaxID=2126342 RepID=A0A450UJB1_9GAMM|nr:MAG: hypothetical protein BECKLFY1418B_GA0070995_103718 [Candidatus Kentron sp. LFY]VFJ98468.1 MAG: hypothetical protein BECKLFY1418A_GA0070994_10841 [Candidatus Kentron sp. LFY]